MCWGEFWPDLHMATLGVHPSEHPKAISGCDIHAFWAMVKAAGIFFFPSLIFPRRGLLKEPGTTLKADKGPPDGRDAVIRNFGADHLAEETDWLLELQEGLLLQTCWWFTTLSDSDLTALIIAPPCRPLLTSGNAPDVRLQEFLRSLDVLECHWLQSSAIRFKKKR